jgi:DNA-directed RNA polymerase subunit RPC12/RpoP
MPIGIYKHISGKKANAFKNGKTLIQYHCIDCGKLLSRLAYYNKYKRCKKCNKKGKLNGMFGKKRPDMIIRNKLNIRKGEQCYNYKGGKPKCINCGKKLSNYGYKRCKSCEQKLKWRNELNRIRVKADTIVKHHIDLNHKNNKKNNILKITQSKHSKLHLRAYEFLVEKKLIRQYIKWFDKKYKLC